MILVVDYGMGNIGSVVNMLRKAGAEAEVSSDPQRVASARKLILPGVGAFEKGMANLHARGLVAPLNEAVLQGGAAVLGICLGAQMFTRRSEEAASEGLGWIDGECVRFQGSDAPQGGLKVPHMGWNTIEVARPDPLLADLPEEPRFYFVHSYYLACNNDSDVLAWTTHGRRFAASVHRGNIWGTQFHPEKSHNFGMAVMRNFAALA